VEGEEDRVSSREKRHVKNAGDGSKGDRRVRWVDIKAGTPTIYSGISPTSFAAEQYLTLAVRIEERISTDKRDPAFVLSVTSPEPAAGKTLTSLNLALTLGRMSERRILLVECDLRRPSLSEFLEGDGSTPGLADILVGEADFSEAVVKVRGTGLDLVGAGSQNKLENLIADHRLVETLSGPRSQYDIVIFDSPPLPLASGRSLANLAEGVLLVVRAGQTKKGDIEEALSSLESNKVLGFVLNGVRRRRLKSSVYGSYAYYDHDRTDTVDSEIAGRAAAEKRGPFPRDFSMKKVADPDEGS
jgi:capsular exopolysaccharide synthesis family protein